MVPKKYLRQRDGMKCGPIAMMNAQIWRGHTFNYVKELARISTLCDASKKTGGTDMWKMDWVLRQEGISTKAIMPITVEKLVEHLKAGDGVILTINTLTVARDKKKQIIRDEQGEIKWFDYAHYVFAFDLSHNDHFAHIANWCDTNKWGEFQTPKHQKVSLQKLARYLDHPHACAWIVKKEESTTGEQDEKAS